MPPRREPKLDEAFEILPPEPAAPPSKGSSLVPADNVTRAMAEVEQKAREVAVKAREVDLQRVSEMDGVTDDIMQSFKNQDWDKVPVKDKAIALGIIQDKREKILVANDPTRPGGKKRPRRATFVFDFKNQQAEVTVEEDGGEE